MKVLSVFAKRSKWFYTYLALFGVINSAMVSVVILFINTKIIGEPFPFLDQYDWQIFSIVVILAYIANFKFEAYMFRLTEEIGIEMQEFIFEYLKNSDYERFLLLKEEKIRTAFYDVRTLQGIPHNCIVVINSSSLIIIGFIYLLFINFYAGLALLTIICLAVFYYGMQLKSIKREKLLVRNLDDKYERVLRDYLGGFRELKMSVRRNDNILSKFLLVILNDRVEITLGYMIKFLKNRLVGKYIVYGIIGVMLFVMPSLGIELKTMTVFITTFLFITGPILNLTNKVEALASVSVSLFRLNEFQNTLKNKDVETAYEVSVPEFNESFRSLRLSNIDFEYSGRDKSSKFKLDKLNFEINKGEIIFITGGNGSGKTTFINLLSGLYLPKSGSIYLNDKKVEPELYPAYRDRISCIYTNNYLFSENYDEFDFSESNTEFHELLNEMKLQDIAKVDVKNNRVDSRLSKGQQKRLALIYSIMEEKEILIFDEWAAEQDPVFRNYFYNEILPDLKERGKTVIAITHDDAYFDCADRMVKFQFGTIVKDEKIVKETAYCEV